MEMKLHNQQGMTVIQLRGWVGCIRYWISDTSLQTGLHPADARHRIGKTMRYEAKIASRGSHCHQLFALYKDQALLRSKPRIQAHYYHTNILRKLRVQYLGLLVMYCNPSSSTFDQHSFLWGILLH